MARKRQIILGICIALAVIAILPEWPTMPVTGATQRDWNSKSYWYEPWGASGVHKGIDVFAKKGTPVVAPTYGLVLFRGEIALGGRVVIVLGPKLRLHYFAHLDTIAVYPGYAVWKGRALGTVGDTGNAKGKPPHLHYAALTLVPYPWRIDGASQGWKKMIYLDPAEALQLR